MSRPRWKREAKFAVKAVLAVLVLLGGGPACRPHLA